MKLQIIAAFISLALLMPVSAHAHGVLETWCMTGTDWLASPFCTDEANQDEDVCNESTYPTDEHGNAQKWRSFCVKIHLDYIVDTICAADYSSSSAYSCEDATTDLAEHVELHAQNLANPVFVHTQSTVIDTLVETLTDSDLCWESSSITWADTTLTNPTPSRDCTKTTHTTCTTYTKLDTRTDVSTSQTFCKEVIFMSGFSSTQAWGGIQYEREEDGTETSLSINDDGTSNELCLDDLGRKTEHCSDPPVDPNPKPRCPGEDWQNLGITYGSEVCTSGGWMLAADLDEQGSEEIPPYLSSMTISPSSVFDTAGLTHFTVTVHWSAPTKADETVTISVLSGQDVVSDLVAPTAVIVAQGKQSATALLRFDPRVIGADEQVGNVVRLEATSSAGNKARAAVVLTSPSDRMILPPFQDSFIFTVGTPITPIVLPAATGGSGGYTYSLGSLPAGLSWNSSSRTISGTPTKATGTVQVKTVYGADDQPKLDENGNVITYETVVDQVMWVQYTITDSNGQTVNPTLAIQVNKALSASSQETDEGNIPDYRYTFGIGEPIDPVVLPTASGGSGSYELREREFHKLPAGLSFDAATRTISGTPTQLTERHQVLEYVYGGKVVATVSIHVRPKSARGKANAASFALSQNAPNPFNPTTTINYVLPHAADVRLTVYNIAGQPVRTLVHQHQPAGSYSVEWDATSDSGYRMASGIYIYALQAGEAFRSIKRMILLR